MTEDLQILALSSQAQAGVCGSDGRAAAVREENGGQAPADLQTTTHMLLLPFTIHFRPEQVSSKLVITSMGKERYPNIILANNLICHDIVYAITF